MYIYIYIYKTKQTPKNSFQLIEYAIPIPITYVLL